jgi:hypothetical protein
MDAADSCQFGQAWRFSKTLIEPLFYASQPDGRLRGSVGFIGTDQMGRELVHEGLNGNRRRGVGQQPFAICPLRQICQCTALGSVKFYVRERLGGSAPHGQFKSGQFVQMPADAAPR